VSDAANLLELQAADLEITRANKRLDELPEKIAILQVRGKRKEADTLAASRTSLRKLKARSSSPRRAEMSRRRSRRNKRR
jgi:hypothetical protein